MNNPFRYSTALQSHAPVRDDARQISVFSSKPQRISLRKLKVVETAWCLLEPVAPPCGMAFTPPP
jgi:hypothetical protein